MNYKISMIVGAIGSWLAALFGGWDISLQTLLIFMAIDIVVLGLYEKSIEKTPLDWVLWLYVVAVGPNFCIQNAFMRQKTEIFWGILGVFSHMGPS